MGNLGRSTFCPFETRKHDDFNVWAEVPKSTAQLKKPAKREN
jgi:hypothetical protein